MIPDLTPFVAQIARVQQEFKAQVRPILREFDRLRPALSRMAEEYARFEHATDRRAIPILRRRGWFGLERYLNVLELDQIVRIYREKGASNVDRFICGRFSRKRFIRLQRVKKDWWKITYMRKRRPKINRALRAYKARNYALAIPALLPLVDGLAAAYFRTNPGTSLPKKKGGKRPTIRVPEAARRYQSERPDYAELFTLAIDQTLYANYDFGKQRPPASLNRHGILHGDILGYDTETNAVKTILLLDVICRVALQGPQVP